jgi:RND family efflux transporter MFP subunit
LNGSSTSPSALPPARAREAEPRSEPGQAELGLHFPVSPGAHPQPASRTPSAALAALIVFTLAIGSGCAKQSDGEEAAQDPELVVNSKEVVTVSTQRVESGITFSGELRPMEIVEIKAKFDADLDAVLVREGQRVRRGTSLARYRRGEIEDEGKAAAAEVTAARAALVAAENAARRTRKLLEAGAAAPQDLESAEAQLEAARARLEAAEARRNVASDHAIDLDVPSPLDGWVSRVLVHGGDRVAIGDPMLTLVDTSELELSATTPAEALAQVTVGTEIAFEVDAFPGERFTGAISRINPTTEPGTGQIRLYTRLPNPEGRLVGGLFATGRVVVEAKDDALAAPVSVLRQEGDETVVYALNGGHARRVPVHLGLRDQGAGTVELIGDLAPGDSLLLGILPGVRDGIRVRRLGH